MELTAKRTKTNKMTALQTLIQQLEIIKKECEEQAEYFNKKDMPSSSISSSAMAYSYGIAIEKAKELLKTEKQQLNMAYSKGIIDGMLPIGKEIMDLSKTYYDNTYKDAEQQQNNITIN